MKGELRFLYFIQWKNTHLNHFQEISYCSHDPFPVPSTAETENVFSLYLIELIWLM